MPSQIAIEERLPAETRVRQETRMPGLVVSSSSLAMHCRPNPSRIQLVRLQNRVPCFPTRKPTTDALSFAFQRGRETCLVTVRSEYASLGGEPSRTIGKS